MMCPTACLSATLLVACGAEHRTAAAAPAAHARPESAPARSEENVSALYGPQSWNASLAAAELARWTPAMHAAAQALADATYPSGARAIAAALKGSHRVQAPRIDKHRHPAETMASRFSSRP